MKYQGLNYDCLRLIFENSGSRSFVIRRLVELCSISSFTSEVIVDILSSKKILFVFDGSIDAHLFCRDARKYQLQSENDIYLKPKLIYYNTLAATKVLQLDLFPKVKTAVIDVKNINDVYSLLKKWFFTLEDLTLIGNVPRYHEKMPDFWRMIQILPSLKRLLLFDDKSDDYFTTSLVNTIPQGVNFENLEKFAITGRVISKSFPQFFTSIIYDDQESSEILPPLKKQVFIHNITDLVFGDGRICYSMKEREIFKKTLTNARSIKYLDVSSMNDVR